MNKGRNEDEKSIDCVGGAVWGGGGVADLGRHGGEGPLYFAAELSFFSLEEPIRAAGNEVFVRRQYHRLAPRPTLDNLPPADAIVVQRFRDLAAVDRCSFGPRGPNVRATRDVIADERNLPGLPGVDHREPLHMILMPRTVRMDSVACT